MITLNEFIRKIKIEDVEGNKTYLHAIVNGRRYGQSYANATNTKEDMIRRFACFYYPFEQEKDL